VKEFIRNDLKNVKREYHPVRNIENTFASLRNRFKAKSNADLIKILN